MLILSVTVLLTHNVYMYKECYVEQASETAQTNGQDRQIFWNPYGTDADKGLVFMIKSDLKDTDQIMNKSMQN